MEKFLERYSSKITGVLSTFDRMNFKGHILSFFQRSSRHHYLFQEKVLFKNFGTYAKRVSEVIKDTANNLAIKEGRPRVYLNSSRDSKEGIARKIRNLVSCMYGFRRGFPFRYKSISTDVNGWPTNWIVRALVIKGLSS